jgi:hypothetical protein
MCSVMAHKELAGLRRLLHQMDPAVPGVFRSTRQACVPVCGKFRGVPFWVMINSMRSRVLVWVAVLVASGAAAGLALDVAVAGTSEATGLAGVIAGFCELAALVLGVTAWAGERRVAGAGRRAEDGSSAAAADGCSRSPAAGQREDGKYVVDARGAEGLQVGDGNSQHIVLRRSSPGS